MAKKKAKKKGVGDKIESIVFDELVTAVETAVIRIPKRVFTEIPEDELKEAFRQFRRKLSDFYSAMEETLGPAGREAVTMHLKQMAQIFQAAKGLKDRKAIQKAIEKAAKADLKKMGKALVELKKVSEADKVRKPPIPVRKEKGKK